MPGVLSQRESAAALRSLGWRVRTTGEYRQVVRHFQAGWALGPALAVDGIVGRKTSDAIRRSDAARKARKGTASPHFSFAEFACRCGGRYRECPRIWVRRDLLLGVERLRTFAYPGGLRVVSGCRCTRHNKAVGGAVSSQHLYGCAADVDPVVRDDKVAAWRLFAGIGYTPERLVRHVDLRNLSGHNLTKGTPERPTRWKYAS